ncbi:transposable element Tcb2 transposase [Trichonephila clavipes]|nr:transposable element Tcb2 transposase [Trichonephila clavipes]
MLEAACSARRVARQLGRSYSAPHTTPTAGVMVWGAIAYNTRSSLVLISGTMTAQRYVHDILQPHVMPLTQRLPGALFNKTMLSLTRQGYHKTATTLSWPARSSDLSPIEHIIWDGELGIPRV